MNYLVDTHTLVWACLSSDKLSGKVHGIVEDRNNKILVSVISFWEVALKVRVDKFAFRDIEIKILPQYAKNMGFSVLDLQEQDAISFLDLPVKENHKDPFDRMLIWQAINNNLTLLSKDKLFQQYTADGLKLLW
ncbi:toxin PIN domain [Candidatus Termititenax aidoneus]|uniref:Toxin PIN domain n=1 Tax=Termititenax aidoneus TaxID=2218524 RepID=A0A388TE27_TERA1|nr:toxin PIN domain [Candidatus Termititenax aidoneus]